MSNGLGDRWLARIVALVVAGAGAACGTSGDCDGDIEFQLTNTTPTVFDVTFGLAACSGAGVLIEGPGNYSSWMKQLADLKGGDVVTVTVKPRPGGVSVTGTCRVAADVAPSKGKDYVRMNVVGDRIDCDCNTQEYAGPACE